ncbi:MAG: PPA1309 family protein [Nocardioidaceae bacterium]
MSEERTVDAVDVPLRTAVRELEAHAAESGWDQPARLFALVSTADLVAREPALASVLGLSADGPEAEVSLTPVEQDEVPAETALEAVLEQIMWPEDVLGCAAVLERIVLPPAADQQLPADPAEAQRFAADHPDREEVRIVAAATRGGSTYCALRMRTHDDAHAVVESPDLVPALLELLRSTLEN